MNWLTFKESVILWFIILIPILVYFYILAMKKKKSAAMKFSALGMIKEASGQSKFAWRRHIQFILLSLAILLMIVGFADPHIPLKKVKEGVNLVLAIDVSGSMKATDYQPNRIEAAKRSAETLLKSLKPDDQVGIVLFESGASTSSFLTPFKDRVMDKLKGIAAKDGATAIGDGLALAVDMVSSIPNKKKIVILLSDGVNNAGAISPQEAIEFARSNKVQVYAIAMGSDEPVILGYDWFGRPQYAEMDEAALKAIAEATGGKFFKSVDSSTLDDIYSTISQDIKREMEPSSIKDYFFIASLLVLLLLMYFNYGKYKVVNLG